ncbi:MAG: HAD family hydrolase [Dehalococcoidia bacterium]
MTIRAVLLDLDGTLVDALGAWGAAFGDALEVGAARVPALGALGDGQRAHLEVLRPLIHEAHRATGGGEWSRRFLEEAFARLLANMGEPDPALASEMLAAYEQGWPRYVRPYPEVEAVLEELASHYRLAVVSNGLGVEQRQKIAPLGLDRFFRAVAISGELGVRKPDPAIFAHTLAALDVAAHEALHVGDDFHADIEGARAAGLAAAIWVRRDVDTLQEPPRPTDARADCELADLTSLPRLVERLSAELGGL